MDTLTTILDEALRALPTRIALSGAIVLSLVLLAPPLWLNIALLVVFGVECIARGLLLGARARKKSIQWAEIRTFGIVLIATLSFVPLQGPGANLLLLGRITRLLLLASYWGPLARDFGTIALQRDRVSQIMLVVGLAVALTGGGAAILRLVDHSDIDLNGDGQTDSDDNGPFDLIWWSARQVMDPGNLVAQNNRVGLLLVSLLLTIGGVLIVAVLVGMGSGLVEDLVRLSRTRRVGLRHHTVVLNITEHSKGVLVNITNYFTKQVRWRRVALQGPWEERPAWLDPRTFRAFYYRSGRPADTDALARLDIESARRVAILAAGPDAEADAEAVTAVLSARVLNTAAWIVVELNRPGNIPAALKAGQDRCIPVPARRLAALVLTQELADHGRATLIQDFVSLEGQEIYTAVFKDGRLADLTFELTLDRPFGALRRDVLASHAVLLLGYFVRTDSRHTPWLHDIRPVLNPPDRQEPVAIRGLIAIAPRFEDLRGAVAAISSGELQSAAPQPAAEVLPLEPDPRAVFEHVIVLGFHDDTVETVAEILRMFPDTEVTIVGDDEADRDRMRATFLAERTETGAQFSAAARKRLHVVDPDGRVSGAVNIRVADRYADGLFRAGDQSGPVGNVLDYDAVILLADHRGSGDPDGGTTLGVLKLMDAWRGARVDRLRRVVAEVHDEAKAALLRSRVATLGLSEIFSFVCTQTLRQNILSQSFFVPGLPPVLHNLITAGDEEIFAFTPARSSGETPFGALVAELGRRTPPLVPLAIMDHAGHLTPTPRAETRLRWAEVASVYALGTAVPVADRRGAPPRKSSGGAEDSAEGGTRDG